MRKEDYFARTMHTPDDPARAETRAALRELSKQLLPLHRALIESARADYHTMIAPISGTGHLLQLLNEDPAFAWLKPITALIVDIDEMVRKDFTPADVEDITRRADKMFGANAEPSFAERYVPVLQRDVDVAGGHAAVRSILARLLK